MNKHTQTQASQRSPLHSINQYKENKQGDLYLKRGSMVQDKTQQQQLENYCYYKLSDGVDKNEMELCKVSKHDDRKAYISQLF